MMNVEIRLDSMILRRLTIADLPLRVDWMNNPLVYSSMHYEVPICLDKTIEWFNRNQQRNDRVDCTFIDETGLVVAFGGITSINREVGKGESYIFTNPSEHHRGIGTEAMKMLCKYGFEELGLNKLYAFTNEDNQASLHLHQKIGYEIEGRHRQEYKDSMGILKDRYYLGYLRQNYCN